MIGNFKGYRIGSLGAKVWLLNNLGVTGSNMETTFPFAGVMLHAPGCPF